MCKKLGVTALVIVAAFFVLHKLDLDSYLKLAWKNGKAGIQQKIPPETKIERLRDEIAKLGPEERKARSVIASEMVQINKLKADIAEANTNLDKKQVMLKDLRAELDKGTTFVTLDNQKIPREKVEASLARKWESFKQAKEAVKSQEELLKSREEALEVAKAKLDAMQEKKKEMEAKVEKLELELRKLRLAQTQHDVAIDDSQLSTVLKLYDEIDTQIKTQQTELSLQKGADTDTAVEEALAKKAKTDKALKEMDEFFGNTKVTKKDKD
jgi:chromosome segregation ATPase